MKKLLVAMCLITGAWGQAHAQVQEANRILRSFERGDIEPLFRELGFTVTQVQLPGYEQLVLAASNEEIGTFLAIFAFCDNALLGCQGLGMLAPISLSTDITAEQLNAYNAEMRMSYAFKSEPGAYLVVRPIISQFGVTRGNVAANVAVFIENATQFGQLGAQAGSPPAIGTSASVSLNGEMISTGFGDGLIMKAISAYAVESNIGIDVDKIENKP